MDYQISKPSNNLSILYHNNQDNVYNHNQSILTSLIGAFTERVGQQIDTSIFLEITMSEFSRYEIYMILNSVKPLWLGKVDLSETDLRGANFHGAIMPGADLHKCHLQGSDLVGANLGGANLQDAILVGADLRRAYLRGADLRRADLREVNLAEADLTDANLSETNLLDANLGAVDLTNANLTNANLTGTNAPDHLILRAKSLIGTVMPDGSINEHITGGKDAGPQS